MILVTGGSGFIGSNFIKEWFNSSNEEILNLDALTYAGNPENLLSLKDNSQYIFVHGNINDKNLINKTLKKYKPRAIINFAAESHVDRSISSPSDFINTNILGTFNLISTVNTYWNDLKKEDKKNFKFIHISTDEVYGSLKKNEKAFDENNAYKPNSPYSASKASSDHLVRSYNRTYNFPSITINCSNNYGPNQFPEKFIPLCINNAITNKVIPIYGDGLQVRDWLYVEDHCCAIRKVLKKGKIGSVYNVGGNSELTNIDLARTICEYLDTFHPKKYGSYTDQIEFIADRPGHDRRYAINSSKIEKELNWRPSYKFTEGIKKTIHWYIENDEWVKRVTTKEYLNWANKHYQKK